MAEDNKYDVIVIGAGHNGLVTSGYLARSGLSVLVLERLDKIGGAATTDEFAPGLLGAYVLLWTARPEGQDHRRAKAEGPRP